MKVQAYSFLEPPLEYSQDQDIDKSRLVMTFLTNLEIRARLGNFAFVLEAGR